MRFYDEGDVAALGYAAAVRAIDEALRGGLDPSSDPPRSRVDLMHGSLLLMPSEGTSAAGIKVSTIAPDNPSRGLPTIQASYLLFDHETLAVRAILDGTALTTLRTPAVSVAAVLGNLPARPLRLAVIGSGPQALGHAAALSAACAVEALTYLVRDPARAPVDALALGSAEADDALRTADVIVCATSARTPLFDSSAVRDDAVVIAVGAHEPDARELDSALVGRSTVVVEDVATALREAGDVVLAIGDGKKVGSDLVPMRDFVTAAPLVRRHGPIVFKGVGMAWQDLVVAIAVVEAVAR